VRINKAHKTRFYPTVKQQKMLAQHFGCARWVYNHFLQYKNDQYKATGKSASYCQMSKLLTELKQQPDKLWLGDISRQCATNSIQQLDAAFNNFFNKKSKHPKFKCKHNRQSFKIGAFFARIRPNGVQIPLVGILKCNVKMPGEYKLSSITISRATTNKYYASIAFEQEIPDPIIDTSKPIIGLDFGLKSFITKSDSMKIEHPQPLKKELRKLRRLNRIVARRTKGSKRRNKAKHKLALQYERIANIRSDFLHKLSRKMVSENQAIYLEDLNIEGMKARWGRKIGDLGWSEFVKRLSYKGTWYGCDIYKIDRFFPSSKTCSKCGRINSKLQLSNREWICSCGTTHDRDINAAKNILEYGRADRNLRPQRVGVVKPLVEAGSQK
jgi:putative transposase